VPGGILYRMVEGEQGCPGATRLRSLDALRGVAALPAVLFHLTAAFERPLYLRGDQHALLALFSPASRPVPTIAMT
jgi:peptidoglycan/LPS O-acetylase OafA/YrhL